MQSQLKCLGFILSYSYLKSDNENMLPPESSSSNTLENGNSWEGSMAQEIREKGLVKPQALLGRKQETPAKPWALNTLEKGRGHPPSLTIYTHNGNFQKGLMVCHQDYRDD
jgi:hypothetical protein